MKMPTNEIARSTTLYVLVADAEPERVDYRGLLPESNVQWGFVQNDEIFAAALRLQPWDVIVVDGSMMASIPSDLLAHADIAEEGHDILLLIESSQLKKIHDDGLMDVCGYVLKDVGLESTLARLLRHRLYMQALKQERSHLEYEIERILTSWEQSIRDRTKNLERKNKELKAVDELKDQFLENISHELRTPLTLVRSYVELLLDCPPESDEEKSEFLRIINSETHRLSRMIDDLLDLSRISAGEMNWNMAEVDLRDLIPRIVGELGPIMAKDNTSHNIEVPFETPRVWGDPDRLAQVLMNLLDNAMKHARGGKIDIIVKLMTEQGDTPEEVRDMCMISVRDTGTGVPPEHLSLVFDRFHQASRDDSTNGAGLGLSICREIVNHHGGRIWAENRDVGAEFSFTLPLAGHLDVISGAYTTPAED